MHRIYNNNERASALIRTTFYGKNTFFGFYVVITSAQRHNMVTRDIRFFIFLQNEVAG